MKREKERVILFSKPNSRHCSAISRCDVCKIYARPAEHGEFICNFKLFSYKVSPGKNWKETLLRKHRKAAEKIMRIQTMGSGL